VQSADPRPSENPAQPERLLVSTDKARTASPLEQFQWPESLALACALALVSLLLTGWVRPLDLWPW
jgi:hypothetical protein